MKDIYIYLIFSKTGTWLSRILYLFTKNKYVHSSISFDDMFTKMYSFGRLNPENPFSGGFVEENLYSGVYKKFKESECVIYKVKISDEQYKKLRNKLEFFIEDKNEYKYNFIGLFGVLINKPLKRDKHYFCSQFVGELLINSNIYYIDKNPGLIKTDDLFLIPNKELVYEGYINDYCKTNSATI